MADTLLTYAQMRAGIPDNATQLVAPVDVRDALISVAPDVGEVGDGSDWVLALTDGVPANINLSSPAPDSEVLRGWATDANAALLPEWDTVVLPVGLERSVSMTFTMVFGLDTSQTRSLLFELLKGGAVVATQSVTVDLDGNAQQGIAFNASELYQPQLGEAWSVQVTAVGNSFDMDISDWDLKARGAIV